SLINCQRSLLQRPRPTRVPQIVQNLSQVVQVNGQSGMVRLIGRLIARQRPHLQQDQSEVVQSNGSGGVVGPIGPLIDRQRPLLRPPRPTQAPQIVQNLSQVVQVNG